MDFSKKGELTSTQIIGIVLAIAGFIVVLIFLAIIFKDKGETNRELCLLSVITRATAPDVLQYKIPLKCTTDKICMTSKLFGGKCKQFAGEENVRVVKLKGNVKEKARIIERESANAMFDCWSMMGEGKVDLFHNLPEKFIGSSGEPTCVICSRVAVSDDVDELILKEVDLGEYLRKNQVPGSSLTYLQTFTDRSVNAYASEEGVNFESPNEKNKAPKEIRGLSDNQIAFVFSQVKTEKVGDVLTSLGGAVVGTAFVIPGNLKIARALFLGPQAIVTVLVVGGVAAAVGFNAYSGRTAAAGYCGNFVSNVEEGKVRSGCSLVQAVNYNVQDINALCPSNVQGSP
ncbi:MAG: hypothetical protein IIA87_00445 [Nanoarchaeota archaeon]|nr:hypothetical protein [Nanoarchaeota archaeon]